MYNKLFSKIVDSSVWMEPDNVRLIWLMFIAIMDEDGFVNLASAKNVAHRAVMDLDKAQQAIEILESPDAESSNPANEGRRITRVPGGWIVNNASEYREIVRREQQKVLNRERVQKHRKKLACNGDVTTGNVPVTQSEAEAYTEAEAINPPLPPKGKRERARFQKPTIEEVAKYCQERKNGIDAGEFWHFYESKGWLVGKSRTPMKSWQSAIVTWEKDPKRKKPESIYKDLTPGRQGVLIP